MARINLSLTFLCLLLVALPLAAQPGLPEAVLQREEAGDLKAALNLLIPFVKANPGEGDAASHLGLLQETIRIQGLAAAFRREKDDERAKAVLESLLAKLDPVRDGHLVVAVARSLREIRAESLRTEEEEARGQLAAAQVLVEAGKYDDALAMYDEVARSPSGQVSREILHEARLGRIRATSAKARSLSPTFWGEIGQSGRLGARTVSQWLVYLIAAALLGLLFSSVRGRIPIRPGTAIQLQELTAPATEQEGRNQHLVREFLQRLTPGGHSAPHGEEFDDFDDKALSHLRLEVDPLADLQTFLHEDTAVQIGPLSLNPRQIVRYLGALFQRPSESTLRGSLTSEEGRVTFNVEHRVVAGSKLRSGCWEVSETGEGARTRAIQGMALRISFELASWKVTADWESFDLYRKAMALLSQDHPADSRDQELTQARDLLRRSLVCDPANWLARFHLATLERTLGNDDMAAEHFEFLERLLTEQTIVDHRRPELLQTVRYNRAVSLAEQEDPEQRSLAFQILDELIANPEGPKTEILARSAKAVALVRDLERAEPEKKGAVFQAIKQEKNWFGSLRLDHKLDWKTYALGYAVTVNAFGRACLRLGFHDVGVDAFREAMIVAPDFVDAYNNLAAVYLDQRRRQDPEWAHKLEDLLQQALQIQGGSQKAHLLLGRYYSLPAIGRYDEAREHLRKADSLSWSYYYLSEILIHQDNNREEALKILRRSIFLDKWPDRRYVSFIESALDVSQRRGGDRVLLKEALQLAEKYAECGKQAKPREREFRQHLLGKVEDALKADSKAGKPGPPAREAGTEKPDAAVPEQNAPQG